MKRHAGAAAEAVCLAGCGGGAAEGPLVQPAAPADRRVQISAYQPPAPAAPAAAAAQGPGDYQFATAPMSRPDAPEAAIVVPALALAQRALLVAAAAPGSLRDDLLAQPADAQGLAAGVARRELRGLAAASAWPEWLQASSQGSALAAAPAAWQFKPLPSWEGAVGTLPAGFAPSLQVSDSVEQRWTWPVAAERFDGVFEFDGGSREVRRMLRLSGSGWRLETPAFSAQALVLDGGVQLIKLRPVQGAMSAFSRSAALGEALVTINQRLRSGLALVASSLVLGDKSPGLADLQSAPAVQRLGGVDSLPFTQLDGRGQYAEARRFDASLGWDAAGVQLAGSQELLFIGAGGSGSASAGSTVNTGNVGVPILQPPACPGSPVLRPELLLAVNAQYRLIWLARLPSQGSLVQACL